MKSSSSCPRCEARIFYCVHKAGIPDHRYSRTDSFRDLTLTGLDTDQAVGVEAWVCRGCGYTEFYARDLALLERMAQSHAGVTIVDRRNG